MVGWIFFGPEIVLRQKSSIWGQLTRLFHGHCIDNLGSVVILRDGGILYFIIPHIENPCKTSIDW